MMQETFSMPMYRGFVPERIRPWIYLLVAFSFQMSGGVYLAALDDLEGQRCWMREDCLMTLYMNMLGLALSFPLLFRTKFRFTNKQLLCFAAVGVIVEQLVCMYCDSLPIVWAVAFLGGYFKLQGTFECLSNIQLWMSPTRDFRVFFPILHIIILGSVCTSAFVSAWMTYHVGWQMMHWLVVGMMLVCLLFFTVCLRSFHHIPHVQPFTGIDWTGLALLSLFFAQVLYVLTYGDWAGWTDSATICSLLVGSMVTLLLFLWRNFSIEQPIVEHKMWTYPHVFPILLLTLLFEGLLASERVLEEIYVTEVMHYGMLTHQTHFNLVGIMGVLSGCAFCYFWLVRLHKRLLPLLAVGVCFVIAYLLMMYTTMSPVLNIERLYPAIFCRQFATATLGICLLTTLQSLVGFMHFFQCLAIFQTLHLCCGSAIGAAVYGETFRRYIALNFAHYGETISAEVFTSAPFDLGEFISETFLPDVMAISLKTIYGWVAYLAVFTLLLILFYDICLKRHRLQRFLWIPSWKNIVKLTSRNTDMKHLATFLVLAVTTITTSAQKTYAIEDLFVLADQNARTIRISQDAFAAAKEEVAAAKSQRLPEIGAQLSIGYNGRGLITDRDFSNPTNIYIPEFANNFSLQVSQVIYSGGAISNSIRLSEMGQRMAELDIERNRQEVRFCIVGLYLDMMKTLSTIKVIEQNIALAEQLVAEMQARVEQGAALSNDVTRYELQLENLRLQHRRFSDTYSIQNQSLCQTLSLPADTKILPDESMLTATAAHDEQFWQQNATANSSLRQTALATEMAKRKVQLAKSVLLPKLALIAEDHLNGPVTIEIPAINKNFNYWFIGLGVQYNLSSLYKSRHDIRRTRLEQTQANERQALAHEQMSTSIHAAHTNLLTATTELQTSQKQVQLAAENYAIVSTRYHNGLALVTDLIDASNAKLSTEIARHHSAINIIYCQKKLEYLCGAL